jgi:DHA1 family bicyclomycin/chloramphenicol resistance-like MFS transporter
MASYHSSASHEQEELPVSLLVLILGALSALGPLAIDMYLPGFPAMQSDLKASPAAVQSTLAVYFIGLATGQLFYGPLSDRWGRKKPL